MTSTLLGPHITMSKEKGVPFWIVDCIMFNLLKHIVVRSITLVQQVYQWITYEMYVHHVYDRPDNIALL
jgi:hypothetical protein